LNEVGEVEKFIAIEMDITEKKAKEELIQKRNQDLENSLNYAKTIQKALLSDLEILKSYCKDYFVYFQPKEEIGGDFYWCQKYHDTLYVVAADCTGHGVPGALLSMYFQQSLNILALQYADLSIQEKFNSLQKGIVKLQNEQGIQDAFEMSMAMIEKDQIHLFTTSAQPIIIQKIDNQIDILKSDNYLGKHPFQTETNSFEFFVIDKKQVKRLFLMSDGIIDQFGGPENKKFGLTRLKSLIAANTENSLNQIIKEVKFSLNTWFNGQEQTDDFLMIGLDL
jgi:serine phosphatase RsbU (regulator of sigma subunit)